MQTVGKKKNQINERQLLKITFSWRGPFPFTKWIRCFVTSTTIKQSKKLGRNFPQAIVTKSHFVWTQSHTQIISLPGGKMVKFNWLIKNNSITTSRWFSRRGYQILSHVNSTCQSAKLLLHLIRFEFFVFVSLLCLSKF